MPAEARRAASAFRAIVTRLRGRRAGAGRTTAKDAGSEAVVVQAALDMHELGVRLYRQRMHREHPKARRREIDGMAMAFAIKLRTDPGPVRRLRSPRTARVLPQP